MLASAAHRMIGTHSAITRNSSGSPQLADTRARGLRFSVNAMWNMCGITTADTKNAMIRLCQVLSCSGAYRRDSISGCWSSHTPRPLGPSNTPNRPISATAANAATLIRDSVAMATTRPSWRSRAVAWRAPNRIANSVINRQNQNATQAGSGSPVRIWIDSATAFICIDSSGSMPTTIITVVSAPARRLR